MPAYINAAVHMPQHPQWIYVHLHLKVSKRRGDLLSTRAAALLKDWRTKRRSWEDKGSPTQQAPTQQKIISTVSVLYHKFIIS